MPTSSVFICHASANKPFVNKLYKDLRKFGVQVWLDEREIVVGDSLHDAITDGLERSDYTIVVLSSTSIKRPWVRKEIKASFQLEIESGRRRILPIVIEDCAIPLFLKDKRYADFRRSYEQGLADLLSAIGPGRRGPATTDLKLERSTVYLDIRRKDGSLVEYEKISTVVSLRDGVVDDIEPCACDGRLGSFGVSPGHIGEVRTETGITYVRTLFPRPLKKNERLTRTFRMKMSDAFLLDQEYWEGKQYNPADSYTLVVKFPKGRPPIRWKAQERDAVHTIPSDLTATLKRPGGRPELRLVVKDPELYRSYILRWWW
jgi:hypothetical protein